MAPDQQRAYLPAQQKLTVSFYGLAVHWMDKLLFGSVTPTQIFTVKSVQSSMNEVQGEKVLIPQFIELSHLAATSS